jgi:hypothetical protein
LRVLCRFLALLGVLNFVSTSVPLYLITPRQSSDLALSGLLEAAAFGMLAVNLVLAFRYMH